MILMFVAGGSAPSIAATYQHRPNEEPAVAQSNFTDEILALPKASHSTTQASDSHYPASVVQTLALVGYAFILAFALPRFRRDVPRTRH